MSKYIKKFTVNYTNYKFVVDSKQQAQDQRTWILHFNDKRIKWIPRNRHKIVFFFFVMFIIYIF